MAAASAKIVHNFTGETGYVIIVPHLTTAPLADVICTIDGVVAQTRKVYPAPHSQESMLVEELNPVWYFFTAYRSADGVALDEQINIIAFNAQSGAIFAVTKIEYQVDRGDPNDPVADDTGLRDARLLDAKYWVEERGTGTLADEEILDRSDVGGGFDFTDLGKVFNHDTFYWVFILNKTDVSPGAGGTLNDIPGIVVIAADTDFDPVAHNGKLLIIQAAVPVIVLTFPNLAIIPDCSFELNTHFGTQRNCVFQLDAGDLVTFRRQARNKITLGEGEYIKVAFVGNQMYVRDYDGDYEKIGVPAFGSIKGLNQEYADGTQQDQADFPRVVELMDLLPAGAVVSYATWNADVIVGGVNYGKANQKKWGRDDVSDPKTFKFPDLRNNALRGLRYVDGTADGERVTQGPGGWQKNQPGPVDTVAWTGTPKTKTGLTNDSSGFLLTEGDGGAVYSDHALVVNRLTARSVRFGKGTETREDNTGFYLLICI